MIEGADVERKGEVIDNRFGGENYYPSWRYEWMNFLVSATRTCTTIQWSSSVLSQRLAFRNEGEAL